MSENSIKSIMDVTMDKLRAMVDANTIIGDPIVVGDVTLLPVSKVSFGLATGGSDFPSKTQSGLFGGGGGAGINITPIAFLVIQQGEVRVLPMVSTPDTNNQLVNMVPELVNKVTDLFSKKKEKKETTTVEAKDQTSEAAVTVTETTTKG